MIKQIRRAAIRDGIVLGCARLVVRLIARSVARANAKVHGIDGRLPLGSQVAGLKGISIEPGFQARGNVWIEAIHDYAEETYSPEISIGARFRASDRLHVSAIGKVSIGDDCLVGSSVFIGDHAHGCYRGHPASDPRSAPASRPLAGQGDISIGANCWIGDNVTILGPVSIGDGVVIAANSVVTKNVPPNCIVAGVPARIVKKYEESAKNWIPVGT